MQLFFRRFFVVLGCAALLAPAPFAHATTTVSDNTNNVLYIECGSVTDNVYYAQVSGSGVVIGPSLVITNAHVVTDDTGYYFDLCMGGVSPNAYTPPTLDFYLVPVVGRYDDNFDYTFLSPIDANGEDYVFNSYAVVSNGDAMTFDEDIYALGYPGVGGSTITVTDGTVAGFLGNWIKSSVILEHGNSGGGAFDAAGNLFGIPTSVVAGELNSISYIQNINAIFEDAYGADIAVRDLSTLYQSSNIFCFFEVCYQYAPDENTWASNIQADDAAVEDSVQSVEETTTTDTTTTTDASHTYTLPDNVAYAEASHDAAMQSRLKGHILLQVEENGEAWYVNVSDGLRYYMRDGDIAYQMMRTFGLGITDSDLEKIPAVTTVAEALSASSVCASNATAKRLSGQILLQVQQHGEAWYVYPDTCRRVYMENGDVAYSTMRYLSLGISDDNLARLPYSATLEIK